jgi:hypothetical protein
MFRSISARDPNENNQKLGLLAALLRAGAWPLADTLLNRLPRTYCVAQVSVVSVHDSPVRAAPVCRYVCWKMHHQCMKLSLV